MSVDITMWVCVRWILAFVPMQVLSCESVYLNTGLLPTYLQVLLCEYVYFKYWLLSVNCTRVVVWIWVRWILSFGAIFTSVFVWIYASLILDFVAIFTSVILWMSARLILLLSLYLQVLSCKCIKLNIGFCSCIYTCCLVNMCTLITSFCPYIYNCCRADMCIDTEFCRYVYKCCRVNVCTLNTGFCCYICKYRVNVCTWILVFVRVYL